MRRALILLLVVMPLSACGLFVSKETRALRKTPDYRAGYQDGCNSAYGPDADKRHDDTIVRDDAEYKSNKAYRSGWNDGEITASQMTLGTVITWLLVLMRRKSWSNPFRAPWIKLSAVGIIGLTMTTVVYNITLMELDATIAIVLLFQFTWITVVMNAIANRRWLNRYQMAAIFLHFF